MNTFENIYNIVSKIPKGKVTTYGAISKFLGINPRVVGFALHANKDPQSVPCHRVINSKGEISLGFAFGGPDAQRKLLIKEGIKFDKNNKVDLEKYGFFLF
jgi:methylated-DNA-protein-cysteine methyltransferase related protein